MAVINYSCQAIQLLQLVGEDCTGVTGLKDTCKGGVPDCKLGDQPTLGLAG